MAWTLLPKSRSPVPASRMMRCPPRHQHCDASRISTVPARRSFRGRNRSATPPHLCKHSINQGGLHALKQLLRSREHGEVCGGSSFHRQQVLPVAVLFGEQNDRDAARLSVRAKSAAHGNAIRVGQHHVAEDQVGMLDARCAFQRVGGFHRLNSITVGLEDAHNVLPLLGIAINQQYLLVHATTPKSLQSIDAREEECSLYSHFIGIALANIPARSPQRATHHSTANSSARRVSRVLSERAVTWRIHNPNEFCYNSGAG